MSQFEHESDDQSEALNKLIRDGCFEIPKPTAADVQQQMAALAQMAEQYDWNKRRDAYCGTYPKHHLDNELYRGISGALMHFQEYIRRFPPPMPGAGRYAYHFDQIEHATRTIHAMVRQELDLYIEAHDEMKQGELG